MMESVKKKGRKWKQMSKRGKAHMNNPYLPCLPALPRFWGFWGCLVISRKVVEFHANLPLSDEKALVLLARNMELLRYDAQNFLNHHDTGRSLGWKVCNFLITFMRQLYCALSKLIVKFTFRTTAQFFCYIGATDFLKITFGFSRYIRHMMYCLEQIFILSFRAFYSHRIFVSFRPTREQNNIFFSYTLFQIWLHVSSAHG